MPDLSFDQVLAAVLAARIEARNEFALQITKFAQKMSEGRPAREVELLLAVALYAEQESRAI